MPDIRHFNHKIIKELTLINTKNTFEVKPLVAVIAGLFSATVTANNEQDIEQITVTTNARATQSIAEVSRSIAMINTDQIVQTQVDHIQQVVNQVAGVNIDRNSGQEMLLAIRSPVLSGAGACGSFLTLENGIALRPTGFCNVNELFESHYELAERIEIIKGPSSVFYGSNGLHGVINVIEPASIARDDYVKATFGQWDYQQLSFLANTDNLAVSSSLTHSGGYRDDAGFAQQKLSLSHVYQSDTFDVTSYLTATNLNQETAGYLVGKDSYKDDDLRRTNPNPEAYRDAKAIRFSQRYDFGNGLIVSPYLRHSEMEFLQHFVPGQPVENNEQTSGGIQSQYTYILSRQTMLHVGADLEIAKTSLVEEQFAPTQGSAFLQATIPQGKHYDYEVDVNTIAVFGALEHQLSEQWLVNAGVRVERIAFDYQNQMNAGRVDENGEPCGFGGCRFNRPESRKDDFTIASPKLGLVYQGDSHQGYINASHGFRAPQATELYRLQREQSVADLDPEEIRGIDAGWRQQIGQSTINLEAYYYDKSDVILRDSDFFYISGGETLHRGIELSFVAPSSEQLSFEGNISYSKHTYHNNPNLSAEDIVGNEIANAPRWLANGFVRYQENDWQLSLHGQYVGDYNLNAENSSEYGGHFLFHLRSQYAFNEDFSVLFNVENLLNRDYAERANYTRFTQERYFPGLPRNVKISLNYQF